MIVDDSAKTTMTTTMDSQVIVSETGAVEDVTVMQEKEEEGKADEKKEEEQKEKKNVDKYEEQRQEQRQEQEINNKRERLGVDKEQLKLIKERLLGDYEDEDN